MTRYVLPPVYTRAAADLAELTRAQRASDGVRVTRGAYVSRSVALTTASAARAALAVLPAGTVASHRTAAVLLGAPLRASWPLEFAVRPGVYRARRQRVRVHVRDLTARDEVRVAGLPVTSGPQTWLDLAARLPGAELVAVGDALYRAGHLDAAALAERLDRADGVRGVVRARQGAPLLTPLAASRPESLIRYWLVSSGLPDPVPQQPVVDRRGRTVAHADLGYEQWRIALEYEGRQHAERRQFLRDLDRYSLMAAHGWLVLRFGEDDLDRRDRVLSRVAGALRSRGARW
ncbi:Protein of unknown function [Geodermatophilus saharensis]|uniref:DUF559 domain-containing protein n=1 Tax=Geodermatophilus saharensis TaxID=1137994 RepID=A0A239FY18_9ACTN|nr:DUF559 domain-containing protein [Geodermatophilus saharensis]SNS61811.1 Protein of unknown function [Geodermatophilus saharensis]